MVENPSQMDPLVDCLLFLAKQHGKNISRKTLTSGLPLVENRLTPLLFIEAAKRIDLKARIIKRPLNKIPDLVLPCVLILKDNHNII